jgi:hypothetical protein
MVGSSKGTKIITGGNNLHQPFLVRTAASTSAENVKQRDYRVKLYSATNSRNVAYNEFQINRLVVHNIVFRQIVKF